MARTLCWSEENARIVLDRYEPVVRAVARRLLPLARLGRALDECDLIAEGRVAVLEAVDSHRGYGIKEPAWVRVRVRQRMIDAIRRLDLRSRDETRLCRRYSAGGTAGTDQEERGRCVQARRLVSMDDTPPGSPPLGSRLADPLEPNIVELTHRKRCQERLLRAMDALPTRQRQAIELGLGGMALREIGSAMGISESRVCQLQKRAVHHLQQAFEETRAAA